MRHKSNQNNIRNGFTLIELIVVMSLISLMLFFAVPKFQSVVGGDPTRKFSLWLLIKVKDLKERSVRERQRYTLNVSPADRKLWITTESMSEEALESASDGGYTLPESLELMDTEFPEKGQISDVAEICFYKQGYSDKVLIHLEDDDNNRFSFLIEPFLSSIKIYEEYVEFEE